MTRENFTSRFDSLADAVEFEEQVLGAVEDLPPAARTVFDGGDPTPEYWTWLCEQADSASAD